MLLWAVDVVADLGKLVDTEDSPDIFPVLLQVSYWASIRRWLEPTAPASLRKQVE